ncbi:hypothetical protein COP2_010278 [Malus domestica]
MGRGLVRRFLRLQALRSQVISLDILRCSTGLGLALSYGASCFYSELGLLLVCCVAVELSHRLQEQRLGYR